MALKTISVPCQKCGFVNMVQVSRKNYPGTGAHYAKQIKKLGNLQKEIIEVLRKGNALSRTTSMTRKEVGQILNRTREEKNERYVHVGSIIGRMSELLGLGIVRMAYGKVDMVDVDQMKMRQPKTPVWWLDAPKWTELIYGGKAIIS